MSRFLYPPTNHPKFYFCRPRFCLNPLPGGGVFGIAFGFTDRSPLFHGVTAHIHPRPAKKVGLIRYQVILIG